MHGFLQLFLNKRYIPENRAYALPAFIEKFLKMAKAVGGLKILAVVQVGG